MSIRKQVGSAARIAALFGTFVVAGMGQQQKGGAPGTAPPTQQQLANLSQQQALLQNSSPSLSTRPGQATGPASANQGNDPTPPYVRDDAKQKRNEERQKRLESEAARLLGLASQLKNEVAASGAQATTPEMVRQMDEIEKLAKSVKEKMRD